MAKEKIPSTPETRAKKLADKKEVSKAFSKTFFAALAVCLSVLLIYSVCYISFFRPKEQTIEGGSAAPASSNTVINNGGSSSTNNGGSAAPADNGGSSSTNNGGSAAPADNGGSAAPADNGGSAAPADNGGSSETPADNSAQSVLDEFNTAINKVKNEGTITHVSGGTKNNGGIDPSSQLPGILKTVGNSVIDAAMSSNGVKDDGSVIDASKFPVEGTGYSSQLTADDIVSATKSGNTITIVVKDDELGEADNGHCSKAMNVIKASTIMDNIPSVASSIASEAKTSAKGGTIVVELDGDGRVVKADYSFNWDIEILGNNLDAINHLASEEHYSIAY